jgi:ribonuclease HII
MHTFGMDEVGRGAMAGPLVAAAVALPPGLVIPCELTITDSKRLTAEQRSDAAAWIRAHVHDVAVETIGVTAINCLGIGWANRAIFARLMARLGTARYMVDGNLRLHELAPPGSTIICRCDGDMRDIAIAAASIVAKVYRDGLMGELHRTYPAYGWAQNAGYGTPGHRRAIRAHGPCAEHRLLYLRRLLGETTAEHDG